MHYQVGHKVFETEEEAIQFSRDLMGRGIVGGYFETSAPATHYYLGDGMTEPIKEEKG